MSRNTNQRTRPRTVRFDLGPAFFFLAYYFCVWLIIDPRLIHHGLGIFTPYPSFVFEMRWPFFTGHLVRVGGLVEYMTRLLTSFYAIGWAGALIITAAAWCAGFFAERLGRRAGWPGGHVLGYVAAAILLLLHSGYSHPLRAVLSILAGLGGFALYVRFAPRPPLKRVSAFLLLMFVVYQIAGAGSLLFPAMVAVDEVLVRRQGAVAAVALVCGLVVPWVFGTLFGLTMKEAYAGFLLANPGVSPERWPFTLALSLFFPAMLGGVALLAAARARAASGARKSRGQNRPSSPQQASAWSPFGSLRTQIVTMAVCTCAIGALAWLLSSSFSRTVLEIDYYSQHEQWTKALKAAERLPNDTYNVRCHRNVLMALCHTERLGDEMCHYGLRVNGDLFYTPERHRDLGSYFQESRLLLDVGEVNEAERCACEALEISESHPAVLQQLAVINMVKGRSETAQVFLRALARQPFQRRTARDLLSCLEEDPYLKTTPRILQIRANMLDRDRVVRQVDLEEFLKTLLEVNPRNRMAFDLLMAYYLSTRRPDRVAANLPRLKEFGYAAVPRHYQEAWVIAAEWPDNPQPIPGFELDPQVLRRSRHFRRMMSEATRPDDAAVKAWEAGLGDSYFFYARYGFAIR